MQTNEIIRSHSSLVLSSGFVTCILFFLLMSLCPLFSLLPFQIIVDIKYTDVTFRIFVQNPQYVQGKSFTIRFFTNVHIVKVEHGLHTCGILRLTQIGRYQLNVLWLFIWSPFSFVFVSRDFDGVVFRQNTNNKSNK